VVHRDDCILQVSKPFVLPDENDRCNQRPNYSVAVDVITVAGMDIENRDPDIPAK
jgi:hypothetical protein